MTPNIKVSLTVSVELEFSMKDQFGFDTRTETEDALRADLRRRLNREFSAIAVSSITETVDQDGLVSWRAFVETDEAQS